VPFVIAAPEVVQAAAQGLAGIRSTLGEASAAAAGPTTAVVAAAEDEVSAGVAALFGAFGQEYQVVNAQAQALQATGSTVFGAALQTGNGVAAIGALVDMPAYVLNGFLNGQTIVNLTMPLSVAGATVPLTMHLPLDGILVPPQPITATVDRSVLGFPVPVDLTPGGMPFEGAVSELPNYMPEQLAAAITPK
jgi:hypothetical protein